MAVPCITLGVGGKEGARNNDVRSQGLPPETKD